MKKRESRAHIWVNTPKRMSRVYVDTILYCYSKEGKVSLVLDGKPALEILESLSDIEKMLASDNFFRCHRKFLLNLDRVEHYSEKCLEAIIGEDIQIPVARNRKEIFRKRLTGE